MINKELFNWLQQRFYRDNHRKYRHYFDEWVKNITNDQIIGFTKQMHIDKNNILRTV